MLSCPGSSYDWYGRGGMRMKKAGATLLLIIQSIALATSQADMKNAKNSEDKGGITLSGMPRTGNPIQNLVKKLGGSGGLWVNGISPTISLPATASVQKVAKKYFESANSDRNKVEKFTVLA